MLHGFNLAVVSLTSLLAHILVPNNSKSNRLVLIKFDSKFVRSSVISFSNSILLLLSIDIDDDDDGESSEFINNTFSLLFTIDIVLGDDDENIPNDFTSVVMQMNSIITA